LKVVFWPSLNIYTAMSNAKQMTEINW